MNLAPLLTQRFVDNNGNALVGGLLYTYVAGTTTPIATYTDSTGGTPNANPVVANSRGEMSVWLNPSLSYKFVLTDQYGALIWSEDNVTSPYGLPISSSSVTYNEGGAGAVTRTQTAKNQESVSVKDFGAVGDGTTDDTAAIQAAVTAMPANGGNVHIPAGQYKITSAISVPGFHNRGIIWGDGDATQINCNSCSAFLFAGQGYSGFTLERMYLNGASAGGLPAIDTTPSTVTFVFTGSFRHLELANWSVGYKLLNAQLCRWDDCNCDMSANGTVFSCVPGSGTGQQCNANRVSRMRITGVNIATIVAVLPTGTERATNWSFEHCDFQQTGAATTPLTILDTYYRVIDCEFENYTGGNLIEMRSDNALSASFAIIQGNILQGGGAAGAGKIYINRTGSQWTSNCLIAVNDAGSPSTNLCDCAGRSIVFLTNQGTINDTSPQYNVQIAGNISTGSFQGIQLGGKFIQGRKLITFNGTMNLDASLGNEFVINMTGGSAVTLNSPTNGTAGQRITVQFSNTSGGAMGVVTWGATFKMAAFTNPANGFSRSVDFTFDGTNWIEVGRTPSDVPN